MRLEDERLDPLVAEPLVAAREPLEVLHARDLEPDEVVRVVHDALRVGLGEPHPDLRRVNPSTAGHARRPDRRDAGGF